MHGTWLGERDGLTLAASFGEPAVWSNPNDIAIRFMAGRYARFENSAIQKSAVIVPNSRATKADLESRYDAPEDWDCEVIHWGVDTGMFVPMHLDSEEDSHKKKEIKEKYGWMNLSHIYNHKVMSRAEVQNDYSRKRVATI